MLVSAEGGLKKTRKPMLDLVPTVKKSGQSFSEGPVINLESLNEWAGMFIWGVHRVYTWDKEEVYLGGVAVGVVHAGVVTLVQPLREGQKPQKTKGMSWKNMGRWLGSRRRQCMSTIHAWVYSTCHIMVDRTVWFGSRRPMTWMRPGNENLFLGGK